MLDQFLSVKFNHSVMSDSLWSHGLQHTRPPCPSPTSRAYSNSRSLSQWCHPTICRPLLLPPSIFPSIGVFSNESVLHIMWPKYWSFSFNISPSNEYWGLISFRMDWCDLLVVQGTLKHLLQHHSSKASVLQHSASFIVQLTSIQLLHCSVCLLAAPCSLVIVLGHIRQPAIPQTRAVQASLSVECSRQEYWS